MHDVKSIAIALLALGLSLRPAAPSVRLGGLRQVEAAAAIEIEPNAAATDPAVEATRR